MRSTGALEVLNLFYFKNTFQSVEHQVHKLKGKEHVYVNGDCIYVYCVYGNIEIVDNNGERKSLNEDELLISNNGFDLESSDAVFMTIMTKII